MAERKKRACSRCDIVGHDVRTCPTPAKKRKQDWSDKETKRVWQMLAERKKETGKLLVADYKEVGAALETEFGIPRTPRAIVDRLRFARRSLRQSKPESLPGLPPSLAPGAFKGVLVLTVEGTVDELKKIMDVASSSAEVLGALTYERVLKPVVLFRKKV